MIFLLIGCQFTFVFSYETRIWALEASLFHFNFSFSFDVVLFFFARNRTKFSHSNDELYFSAVVAAFFFFSAACAINHRIALRSVLVYDRDNAQYSSVIECTNLNFALRLLLQVRSN